VEAHQGRLITDDDERADAAAQETKPCVGWAHGEASQEVGCVPARSNGDGSRVGRAATLAALEPSQGEWKARQPVMRARSMHAAPHPSFFATSSIDSDRNITITLHETETTYDETVVSDVLAFRSL
jgi:hypothetical protein